MNHYFEDYMRKSDDVGRKRKKMADDVVKRSTYRRAHGLEIEGDANWDAWTVRTEAETPGRLRTAPGPVELNSDPSMPPKLIKALDARSAKDDNTEKGVDDTPTVSDTEPSNRPGEAGKRPIKKWFGIW